MVIVVYVTEIFHLHCNIVLKEYFNPRREFQSQNQLHYVRYKELSIPTMWKKNEIKKWTNKASKCLYESTPIHFSDLVV